MAFVEYHNNIVTVNDIIYDSHKSLIEKVTMELGCYEKSDALIEKFLDKPKLKCKIDKNAPKKPKSAFMHFCDTKRPEVMQKINKSNKEKNIKFNLGKVQKELGQLWTSLNEDQKEIYTKMSEDDKERYSDEYEKYQDSLFGNIYQ